MINISVSSLNVWSLLFAAFIVGFGATLGIWFAGFLIKLPGVLAGGKK